MATLQSAIALMDGTAGAWVRRNRNFSMIEENFKAVQGYMDQLDRSEIQLAVLVEDGGSIQELEENIMGAAQRSRTGFLEMVQDVTGMNRSAGTVFQDSGELIAFTELMNKGFAAAGTTGNDRAAAMAQVGQAMGNGGLAATDIPMLENNAPLLIAGIEAYLGKAEGVTGTIEDWAASGLITAEVMKNAVFSAEEEIESRMAQTPLLWEQIWAGMENTTLSALSPALGRMGEIAESGQIQTMMTGVIGAFAVIAGIAAGVFGLISGVGAAIVDHWSTIGPLVGGAVTALLLYKGALLAINAATAIKTTLSGLAAASEAICNGETLKAAAAAASAAGAQNGWNLALLACPLTWVIVALIAIVAAVFAVVGAINKLTGSSISAVGVICGGLNVVLQFFKNLGLGAANLALGIWEALGACVANIKTAFGNVWINIQVKWLKFVTGILEGVQMIIEWLNKIPGVNISTGGISDMILDNTARVAELQDSKGEYEDIGAAFNRGASTFEAFSDGWMQDAYNSGYGFGEGLEDKVKGAFHVGGTEPPAGDAFDPEAYGMPALDGSMLEGIYDNTGAIAGNTAEMRDTVELSGEELSLMRELAEQRAINRYTTAEITVNQHNENHMDGSADLDGIMEAWSADFAEKLDISAEGVHL